ncbi:hypothetical protein MIND_01111400 [Mycena indigotica]|uniref:Uncharacterized protein n=1 Tax=Mycena indigotica TaxID=2126181 RepID=A0A8H6SBH9_9AGAR|nr:uncharacterized protein MIND_01111400 [Mycena indigotica]KAF7295710.1 hypothetical protein MIND_01111400 [Mycena indigotica]
MSTTIQVTLNVALILVLLWTQRAWMTTQLTFFWYSWLVDNKLNTVYGLILVYLLIMVHLPHYNRRRGTLFRLHEVRGADGHVQKLALRQVSLSNEGPVGVDHPGSAPIPFSAPLPAVSVLYPSGTLASWDGFPDGLFQQHFTRQQVEDTFQLSVHWASTRLPGRSGSQEATTLQRGPSHRFRCAGAVICSSCSVTIPPAGTSSDGTTKQLQQSCLCGAMLIRRACDVEWTVTFFAGGAFWENGGLHTHPTFTHSLAVGSHDTYGIQRFVRRQPILLGTHNESTTSQPPWAASHPPDAFRDKARDLAESPTDLKSKSDTRRRRGHKAEVMETDLYSGSEQEMEDDPLADNDG